MLQEKKSLFGKQGKHLCRIVFINCCLHISLGLSAAEVYRWVDENGVVTYSQQKPDNISSSSVTTTGTPPSALIAQEQARVAQESPKPDLTEIQKQKLDELQTREAERIIEEATYKAALCEISTKRLAQLTEKGRVRVANKDGSLRILPEEERQERIATARKEIGQNCN